MRILGRVGRQWEVRTVDRRRGQAPEARAQLGLPAIQAQSRLFQGPDVGCGAGEGAGEFLPRFQRGNPGKRQRRRDLGLGRGLGEQRGGEGAAAKARGPARPRGLSGTTQITPSRAERQSRWKCRFPDFAPQQAHQLYLAAPWNLHSKLELEPSAGQRSLRTIASRPAAPLSHHPSVGWVATQPSLVLSVSPAPLLSADW